MSTDPAAARPHERAEPGTEPGAVRQVEHAALRDPAHRVSPTAKAYWALGALMGKVVLLGIPAVLTLVFELFSVPWWVWLLLVVASVAHVAVMPVVRYRVHRWESTETAVYTQVGWLSRERRIAPMSKVQTVDLDQSALARLFGLASVTVTTASAAGPLSIDGIDVGVAERLVADLTRRTESEAGDAT